MELKWTSKALSDLARLYDFLVLASKPAAARMVQSLTQAPVILLTHPRMGEQLFQFEPREVRRIFAGEYEIRYELNGQTIYVLRLWHTRENRYIDIHKKNRYASYDLRRKIEMQHEEFQKMTEREQVPLLKSPE